MKRRLLAALMVAALALLLSPSFESAGAATAPSCGATIAKAGGGYWRCTFADEFNGSTLDTTKWMVQRTALSGFHSGAECFVNLPQNVSVSSGALKLTAVKEAARFTCASPLAPYKTQYTSGSVSTWGKFAQTYGRFEIRAKFPADKVGGLQGAVWLNPQKMTTAPWPADGEIDIAEAYSRYSDRAIPYIHYNIAKYDPTVTNSNCLVGSIAAFHTYAAIWTTTSITITIDGKVCTTHQLNPKYPLVKPAPFNKPFALYLTQALGIGQNGFRPYATTLPATTQIDYVHIWS